VPVPVEQITKDRLDKWAQRLSESHATPMMLLGVGHDQHKGTLVVCTLEEEELDNAMLCGFLRAALYQLGGGAR
jgi:hypothetical protein